MIDKKGLNVKEWRMSDPSIAGDGSMQKSQSVKSCGFFLSSDFFCKKNCFAVATYFGGSSSSLVASFAVIFGLGGGQMAGEGVRGDGSGLPVTPCQEEFFTVAV